jgi:hypothetical protein
MNLPDFLVEADRNYDSEICLLGAEFHGPGYHSLIPDGAWAHSTRDSIYYALHLLKSNDKELEQRALNIIKTIVSLQDINPYSLTYGIWSWLYEEPLDDMSPPDWNWADFIGAALAHVLKDFGDRLPETLRGEVADSIGHAAWSIFRRNMQPHYTNIAIMGIGVTAVAGEVLQEKRLVDYARIRIKRFYEYTMEQGGLNEYNSPCYTFVALHEFERIIQLVNDSEIVVYAEKLRCYVWKCLAEHYHPATGQLAGPHSRAYSDLLKPATVHYLDWATSSKCRSAYEYDAVGDFETPFPCPAEYVNRFVELPEPEMVRQDTFIKRDDDAKSVCGTTWMNEEAALGSINRECFWTQRRPLIGYWLDDTGKPAVLRLRMLKDGKDFASGGIYNVQSKNKVLTGIKMYTDRGGYHIHLDRPEDGIFKFKSLVLRYELTGAGANVTDDFELICGNWKAVVKVLPGSFNGVPIQWRTGKVNDCVYLEAVLYEGVETGLLIDEQLQVKLALSVEILRKDEDASIELPVITEEENTLNVVWQNMLLNYGPYSESYD